VGKNLVAKMLTGSQSKDVTGLRLDKLSTFGLMSDLKQAEAVAILDALISVGLIEQIENQKFRPVVQNTERGADVMRGIAPFTDPLAVAPPLLAKLNRRKVMSPAASPPEVPADETPVETPSVAKNGDAVDSEPFVSDAPEPVATHTTTDSPPADRPSHYWTWRLLSAGFSLDDCRHIRGLSPEGVIDHALRAVEQGLAVDIDWFLSREQIAAIETVVGREPPERIRPLLAKLPKEIRYEHIQLFLRCRLNVAARQA
jgi:uncharacterized protein YpbB